MTERYPDAVPDVELVPEDEASALTDDLVGRWGGLLDRLADGRAK